MCLYAYIYMHFPWRTCYCTTVLGQLPCNTAADTATPRRPTKRPIQSKGLLSMAIPGLSAKHVQYKKKSRDCTTPKILFATEGLKDTV